MNDYTLSELARLSGDEIKQALEERSNNLMEINATIERIPDSPHTKARLTARKEELKIIDLLQYALILEYKNK